MRKTATPTGVLEIVAFDADDTLWHHDPLFAAAQDRFKRLLASYHDEAEIERRLYETEARNLEQFGYGVKGFTLSMIETAIELTEGRITGREVQEIIRSAREMLNAPIHLLDGVRETIASLSNVYRLMLITKGDLLEQEAKLTRSGLSDYFSVIEIVSHKEQKTYEAITQRHAIAPARFLMVGNSIKYDVLPVLAMGGRAVHIPYHTNWPHEAVSEEALRQHALTELEQISLLPAFLNTHFTPFVQGAPSFEP
ncbi:MAG: HAD family hydrolase [Acidobacteriaceae bacterium]|nr:HAD family hydrolase [Acidobacteriaceae bacterium]